MTCRGGNKCPVAGSKEQRQARGVSFSGPPGDPRRTACRGLVNEVVIMLSAPRALGWSARPALVVVSAVGCACGGRTTRAEEARSPAKVTRENYDRISRYMPRQEVEKVLGKGQVRPGAQIEGFAGEVEVWEEGK